MRLREIGEDPLIRRIQRWLRQDSARSSAGAIPPWAGLEVLAGIGDDAAIVRTARGAPPLAVTTDMMIEGVHFLPAHPPELLGAKAVASNLSDLAAVGAWPAWILVSLGAPADTPLAWAQGFYRGVRKALRPYGAACIGGDCVRSRKRVVNIVAGGNCDPKAALPLRSRARPGQSLYVTGTLGDSGAGLSLLASASRASRSAPRDRAAAWLIRRHQCPTPRVAAGMAIARLCPDAAMMDLSDGLTADLPRLGRASGCGFEVLLPRLPLSALLRQTAKRLDRSAETFALYGGEDYELVFATAAPFEDWRDKVARAAPSPALRVTCIGVATRRKGIRYLDASGKEAKPPGSPFRHY